MRNASTVRRFADSIVASLLLAVTLALSWPASAEDWPHWRGPRGDGSWRAPRLPERWPTTGLKAQWSKLIGGGYSGVSVVGNRVFTMERPAPSKKGANPDGTERVLCLDADTGEVVWKFEYPAHYGDLDYGNGPRASPTVVEGQVYTLGAVGMAACLDARTGEALWSQDTVREFGAKAPTWGFAASPVVLGELVLLHVGAQPNGSLLALDRRTGKEVWRSVNDPAGYATPLPIQAKSGPQIVLWTPEHVHGLDPKTGNDYWSVPYKVTYGVSIATPIFAEGIVFVSGYWEGSKAIRLGSAPTDATLAWTENRFLRGLMAPPLYREGFVYTLDKQYGLTCFELATGRKRWDDDNKMTPKGRNPQATFVWTGEADRVLVLNSDGELILARFNPQGYREDGRTKIIGETWANPAFAGDSVYARNDKEIVRVPLAGR